MKFKAAVISTTVALSASAALLLPAEAISSGFSLLQVLTQGTGNEIVINQQHQLPLEGTLILLASSVIGFIGFTRRKSILSEAH